MPSKSTAVFEESQHYGGTATVKFYPGNHGYFVTDKVTNKKNARTGGATSLTGVMNKGEALSKWYMTEQSNYLKQFFETTTLKQFSDSKLTINDVLDAGKNASTRKSDRGKSVGTDAHAWVEKYLLALKASQGTKKKFKAPDIPEVEEIMVTLRKRYLDIANSVKPKSVDEYRTLPELIMKDLAVQESLWIESMMVRRSITSAKAWFERHKIKVHGCEDTVYSRKMFFCGKYDADLEVTCSGSCGWCYLNMPPDKVVEEGLNNDYTGRYITDFKSTNANRYNPKGIYSSYLAQCAVYDLGKTEEFPDLKYDGYLILNGSKAQPDQEKGETWDTPLFHTHFSFERDKYRSWAMMLAELKEIMYFAEQEIKRSQ